MLNSQTPSHHTTNNTVSGSSKESPELSNSLIDAISAYTEKRKKPKRNRSAFILFSIDLRKKIKHKELDDLNPNDKFVKIAQLWKEISEEERRVYEERAKLEKEKYTTELNAFCRIFPSEPIQRPRNHIKKPCNAYGFYLRDMKEEIRKVDPKMRMCEVLRIVGEKWKHLSPEKKQVYEERAEIGRKNFKAQISKQMQAGKKTQTTKTKSPLKKEEEEENTPENTNKRHKDLTIKDQLAEEHEPKEKKVHLNPPTNLSISSDQENIRPNFPQQTISPQIPQIPGSVLNELLSSQPFQQRYSPTINPNFPTLIPPFTMNEAPHQHNQQMMLPLMELYMRVEYLRQQILMQMQNTAQALPLNITQTRIPLLEQMQGNATPSRNEDSRPKQTGEGFVKEEL